MRATSRFGNHSQDTNFVGGGGGGHLSPLRELWAEKSQLAKSSKPKAKASLQASRMQAADRNVIVKRQTKTAKMK